jgi:hypothetical protein
MSIFRNSLAEVGAVIIEKMKWRGLRCQPSPLVRCLVHLNASIYGPQEVPCVQPEALPCEQRESVSCEQPEVLCGQREALCELRGAMPCGQPEAALYELQGGVSCEQLEAPCGLQGEPCGQQDVP